jgi:hypothetical protein
MVEEWRLAAHRVEADHDPTTHDKLHENVEESDTSRLSTFTAARVLERHLLLLLLHLSNIWKLVLLPFDGDRLRRVAHIEPSAKRPGIF